MDIGRIRLTATHRGIRPFWAPLNGVKYLGSKTSMLIKQYPIWKSCEVIPAVENPPTLTEYTVFGHS